MSGGAFSAAVRGVVDERSGGRCEVCFNATGVEYHHRRPRGSGGTRRESTGGAANSLLLCRECHGFVESYRTWARDRGYLVSQFKEPGEVPVQRRRFKALLGDDGSVTAVVHHVAN